MIAGCNSVSKKVYQNAGNPDVLVRVPDDAKHILDVGCGAGDNARQLIRSDRKITGITLSEDEAEMARSFCDRVVVANAESGLPNDVSDVDAVICSHVLEHICFPEKLLKDVRSALNPGGVLIVALPNVMVYRYRLRLMLGRFDYEPHGIMDNTHFRWYTFQSAQTMLRGNGFAVKSAEAQGAFPLWPMRRLLPNAVAESVDRLACKAAPGLFGSQMVFTATVSNGKSNANE